MDEAYQLKTNEKMIGLAKQFALAAEAYAETQQTSQRFPDDTSAIGRGRVFRRGAEERTFFGQNPDGLKARQQAAGTFYALKEALYSEARKANPDLFKKASGEAYWTRFNAATATLKTQLDAFVTGIAKENGILYPSNGYYNVDPVTPPRK